MEGKGQEDCHAVKSDLARIDFDFDFNIDVGPMGSSTNNQNFEQDSNKILEYHQQMLSQDQKGVKQDRKSLSKEEKDVVSEMLKSQTDKDIISISDDITKKADKLSDKELLQNILKYFDLIGLFGHQNRIADLDFNYEQYLQFAQSKHNLKSDNVRGNIPKFVKAFYEYLLANY